jgi:hypothetical protein
MPVQTLSIPDLPSQFARLVPDGQLRLRSLFVGVFVMATAFSLLIFVRDARIDPVPQSSLRVGVGCFRAASFEQIGVQYPAVEIESPVRRVAASIRLGRNEGGVSDTVLWLADSDLQWVDAEFHHPVLDMVVQRLGVPLGEFPGVRLRIVPQRPLRWRRADHAGLAAEEMGETAEGIHAASLSHRRSSRNQADAQGDHFRPTT